MVLSLHAIILNCKISKQGAFVPKKNNCAQTVGYTVCCFTAVLRPIPVGRRRPLIELLLFYHGKTETVKQDGPKKNEMID